MRKITLATLIFCCLILVLTGCRNSKVNIENKSDIQISNSEVSMAIKNGTLTNTGATIILTNNSDKFFTYGNPYEIEIKKNGEWYKIDTQLVFTLPTFELASGETKEIELNWEDEYGTLAKGTYRIIKDIDYEYEEGKYEKFNVGVEFVIE